MISADLKFEGFDSASWTNLLSLFSPGVIDRIEQSPARSDDPEIDRGSEANGTQGSLIIIVDEQDRVVRSFHSGRGRVRDLDYRGPDDMPALCERYGARRCIVLRVGAMDEVSERLAMRLERGDDYVTQWLALLRILREVQDAKLIRIWPRTLAHIPVPSPGTVRKALDVLLPADRSMVFVLWHRGRPWTSAAVRRHGDEIDLVVGPDLIWRWTGPLGGDWRRDHRIVVDAVSEAVGPVHVGVFAELETLRDLLRRADPGAWATAVATRDVVVHPMPAYIAVAVGADAVRGAASHAGRILGKSERLSAMAPLANAVRGRIRQVASLSATLGFNPLEALGAVLRRYGNDDAPT